MVAFSPGQRNGLARLELDDPVGERGLSSCRPRGPSARPAARPRPECAGRPAHARARTFGACPIPRQPRSTPRRPPGCRLNVIVGSVHALQAIVLLAIATAASLPITASFLTGPPGAGDYGSADLGRV